MFLHPFDDPSLVAGYGSLGLEILESVPDVDIVLCCCGGGGALAGVSTAIHNFKVELVLEKDYTKSNLNVNSRKILAM